MPSRFSTAVVRRSITPAVLVACCALVACQQDVVTAPATRTLGGPSAAIGIGSGTGPGPVVGPTVPTLAPITLPSDPIALQTGGVTVPVSTSFTDPGGTGPYTVSLTCGSGSASPMSPTVPTSQTAGSAGGTCVFSAPGVYSVTLTVTNASGGRATQTPPTSIVVYDAGAGFVTGGGWITSPAGAYVADRSLSGRANFGFVAKYQNGAAVPTGQTEFQLQVGGLNFHSTSYQWLVVADGRAQYKGQGTINGSGDYRFLITAIDGHVARTGPDQFRIEISDASGGTVYDNQMNQSETSSSATVLSGGAITIHK